MDHLYRRKGAMQHPFPKTLRLRMLDDFLQRTSSEGDLSLDHLTASGLALQVFAVHDLAEKAELTNQLLDAMPTLLPLERLREYVGEKVAFYFAFLDAAYYAALPLALVGVAFEIPAVMFDDYSRAEAPAFAFFAPCAIIICAGYRKRDEQLLATKWNCASSSAALRIAEHRRYGYYGQQIASYVDGSPIVFFSPRSRLGFYALSLAVSLLFLAVALAGVAAIYFGRWQLMYVDGVRGYVQWIAGCVTGVQILLANALYLALARLLTSMENHRIDLDYERALTVKVFAFNTVNALSSFAYLAFAAEHMHRYHQRDDSLGECGYADCMTALAVNMTSVVGTLLAVRIGAHLLPYASYACMASCCGYYADARYSEAMQPILSMDPRRRAGSSEDEENQHQQQVTGGAEADDLDQEDLPLPEGYGHGGRGEGRGLNAYMQRQQTTVFLKEKGSPTPSPPRRQHTQSPVLEMRRQPSATQTMMREAAAEAEKSDEEDEGEAEAVSNPFHAPRPAMDVSYELLRGYSHIFTVLAIALCFGAALPAVYLGLAVYLFVEIRGQGWALLHLYPRCLPASAEGIGLWAPLLDVLLVLATLTNASLVILTMRQFRDHWSLAHCLLLWIGMVAALLTLHALLHFIFSQLPEETVIQQQRMQFIAKKLIERLPDKEDTLPLDML